MRRLRAGSWAFSNRMGAQELRLRGHIWAMVCAAGALAICLHGGWLGSRQIIQARFDPAKVPVAAVDFLQKESVYKAPITEPVFSIDSWGGYLIYRLYPQRLVVLDDRHDLYGSDRIWESLVLLQGEAGWQQVLEKWRITHDLAAGGIDAG